MMPTLLSAAVPFLFFGTLAASAWYVDARVRVLLARPTRWQTSVATACLIVGAVASMGVTATSANAAAGVLYVLAGYFLTFFLYLLLALLCLHAVQRFRTLPKMQGAMAAVLLALAATGLGALQAKSFVVSETEIRLPGLKHEVQVMQISDVHLGHHRGRDYLARIVEETNHRKPDLVLITGDLVDSNAALEPKVFEPLSEFAAPVYFVGGNHESYIDSACALELIARQGVKILHNEVVETKGIQLVGLDYMKADEQTFDMHPSADTRTIQSTLADLPVRPDLPAVLMHHSPVGIQYAAAAGIELMLAGHTHGGQLFPATIIAGLLFPFNQGLYVRGDAQVFVSQGAGTFLPRIRLGTVNEINLIRLLPSKPL